MYLAVVLASADPLPGWHPRLTLVILPCYPCIFIVKHCFSNLLNCWYSYVSAEHRPTIVISNNSVMHSGARLLIAMLFDLSASQDADVVLSCT